MERIYVTTMYRYGDNESHSYIIYAGFDLKAAIWYGKAEHHRRGNKYDPEVVSFIPDEATTRKVELSLKE